MTKPITPFELFDRIDDLEQTRSFVASILNLAYASGNEIQIEEFSAKLAAIDKEIETLNAQA